MPRIKFALPATYSFSTVIPIRVTDINYGGHVGNDTILSLLHEARVQFLRYLGYNELDIGGVGLIMSDVAIDFKKELFYGNNIRVLISAGDFTKFTFELYYKIELEAEEKSVIIATAKTGMVSYDYKNKKIEVLPEYVKSKLMSPGQDR